jgi:hypothetical protein
VVTLWTYSTNINNKSLRFRLRCLQLTLYREPLGCPPAESRFPLENAASHCTPLLHPTTWEHGDEAVQTLLSADLVVRETVQEAHS